MIPIIFRKIFFITISAIAIVLLSVSCMSNLEDDVKMDTIPIPEGIKVGSVELGSKYTMQAYYYLSANKIVETNTIYDYDLAFECAPEGWHILVNSSRFMHAGNTLNKNFDEVTSPAGVEMNYDPSSGNLDSTAVGKWFGLNGADTVYSKFVYVIDLGLDENGNALGYKKVVFENLNKGIYTFRHANLDGTADQVFSIKKDETMSFIGFSFENGGTIVLKEPEKSSWDLFFGQYTTLLYAGTEPYPYLVRGVLSNREGVDAILFEGEKAFAEIEYSDAITVAFPDALDGIGHDWKYYNLEEGFYAVETGKVYIIRDAAGNYFKLHFLSYFNEDGENGYPQFECKRLTP